jgi:hypothetical protein
VAPIGDHAALTSSISGPAGRNLRPFSPLAASFLVAGAALLATGEADAAPSRPIPAEAKKYTASFSAGGAVRLGTDAFWLSPGAQIRDADNRIVLPSHLRGEYKSRALFDLNGQVHRVWLLTPEEIAAPVSGK